MLSDDHAAMRCVLLLGEVDWPERCQLDRVRLRSLWTIAPLPRQFHRTGLRTINSDNNLPVKTERSDQIFPRVSQTSIGIVVRTAMSSREFDKLQPRLHRLAPETVAIARAVLVEGESQSFAAERFGTTRQRVHGIVQRVEAAANNVPAGWRKVECWLPPKVARCIEMTVAKRLADWKQGPKADEHDLTSC
jgi:TrfB plasmid transcriptional repressor